jgi:hypothetical protein
VLKGQEQEMLTLDGNHVFRAHFDGPSACLCSPSLRPWHRVGRFPVNKRLPSLYPVSLFVL